MTNLQDKPVVVNNPVEIDRACNDIRLQLANLPWVSHPYHIAQRFYRKENQKSFYYPETYAGGADGKYRYHRLTPDNDYSGMFFFIVGREVMDNFNANKRNFLTYEVGIVFSCNLELIDKSKLELGLYTQELIRDVRRMLTDTMINFDFMYEIKSITRDLREVYREFVLDDIEQYNRAKMQCFRVNLEIKIKEEC